VTYRARDLLLVPCLLSSSRLPLAALFPLVSRYPIAELVVLFAAGATDIADGWWARRYGQATPTGAALDPITDKVFVGAVVATLVARGVLAPPDIVLLAMREIGEVPLVVWFVVSHAKRQARAEQPLANVLGKTATLLQFLTVAVVLFTRRYVDGLLVATAVVGAVAALAYWARELRHGPA
jgi:cardiolipin synthase (CMP-forming)